MILDHYMVEFLYRQITPYTYLSQPHCHIPKSILKVATGPPNDGTSATGRTCARHSRPTAQSHVSFSRR